MRFSIASLLPIALLAACGDGKGTNISFSAEGGDVTARADAETGRVAIDTPGFKANLKLPKMTLGSEDMDIDGVKLFPGSRIETIDVAGKDVDPEKGNVRIAFDAPGAPGAVRGWFEGQMREAGFAVRATGQGFSGTTKDGDPFTLELSPSAGDHTSGTIALTDRN